jgi:hypothetical protein
MTVTPPEPPGPDEPTSGSQPTPPEPPPPVPAAPPAPPTAPGYGFVPQPSSVDRVRLAYQDRGRSDYLFSFWTALGWTLLTCGLYFFYVFYQLMRRMRDHNRRRLELLEGAATFAWERASEQGVAEELRPNFERMSTNLAALRQMTTDFRDPAIWTLLSLVASTIVHVIAFIFLDQDLVKHDYHEGAIEAELSAVYGRLGQSVPAPDPSRLKGNQNYVGRVLATVFSCGFYFLWWTYNMMNEPNEHFLVNWKWEDSLAVAVQALDAPAQT